MSVGLEAAERVGGSRRAWEGTAAQTWLALCLLGPQAFHSLSTSHLPSCLLRPAGPACPPRPSPFPSPRTTGRGPA